MRAREAGGKPFGFGGALFAGDGISRHDPEKWEPVFGQDHAPTKISAARIIGPDIGEPGIAAAQFRGAGPVVARRLVPHEFLVLFGRRVRPFYARYGSAPLLSRCLLGCVFLTSPFIAVVAHSREAFVSIFRCAKRFSVVLSACADFLSSRSFASFRLPLFSRLLPDDIGLFVFFGACAGFDASLFSRAVLSRSLTAGSVFAARSITRGLRTAFV